MKRGSKVFFKETTRPIAHKKTDEETREVSTTTATGTTFATSNLRLQAITREGDLLESGGELSFFDDEYTLNEIQDEKGRTYVVPVVDCESGLETNLSQLENDWLTYIDKLIDASRNDPKIKEFRRKIPSRILERIAETKGQKYDKPRLTLETYPTLKDVRVRDFLEERYKNPRAHKNRDNATRALYSVSRKGYPFVFRKSKKEGGEIIRKLDSRFIHITNQKYVKDKSIKVKGYKKEDDVIVRYEKEIKLLESCDIIVEDVFFYFSTGFTRQPTNILERKRDANVPNNELYEFLYYYIVRRVSGKAKEVRAKPKKRKRELLQDESLTNEERTAQLDALLDKYATKLLTIKVSASYVLERLRNTSYHRKRDGKVRNAWTTFDEQLPEVVRALKDIGLVIEYHEGKDSLGQRQLQFIINKDWYEMVLKRETKGETDVNTDTEE